MGSTAFGNFDDFCKDSTLPVCNLLSEDSRSQIGPWGGCELTGIPLSGDRQLANVGSIILCGLGIAMATFLILKSDKKKAAVGRREIQLFLFGYILISICEIFSVGGIPLGGTVRVVFSGIHIGLIIATTWILMLNAVVGYQLLDDGTPLSMALLLGSAGVLFVGTGYIALDTGFSWTGFWDSSYQLPNRNIALYVLYQLVPLVFLVAFLALETILVLRILGEFRPMFYLAAAAVLFAVGQVFNYVVSKHICDGTNGKIDGALFETLFTLLAVGMVWVFWSSITEDDWPMPATESYTSPGYTTASAAYANTGYANTGYANQAYSNNQGYASQTYSHSNSHSNSHSQSYNSQPYN
ncbi:chitin synthase III catalytic subunit [Trichoderma barbatum]